MIVMTIDQFRTTLAEEHPPRGVQSAVVALWHDAKGDWEEAHRVAQAIDDESGAWVHAYLHRKEGDISNAGYWYRRAGQPEATDSLDAEWERIASALLQPLALPE
jgi:hypothetical protein